MEEIDGETPDVTDAVLDGVTVRLTEGVSVGVRDGVCVRVPVSVREGLPVTVVVTPKTGTAHNNENTSKRDEIIRGVNEALTLLSGGKM